LILEGYVDLSSRLSKVVAPEAFDPKEAAREKARLYIDDANKGNEGLFIKQSNLLKAAQILRGAGLNEEAGQLNTEAESLGAMPEFTSGFLEFSSEQTLPADTFVKLAKYLSEHKDKAGFIAHSQNFMPYWSKAKEGAKEESGSSIGDLVSSVSFNQDNMPIARASGDEKLRKVMRHYDAASAVSTLFLTQVLRLAIADGSLKIRDISKEIDKVKIINESTYLTIKLGLKHLFNKKYYEAVCVLVPQIEDLLGDIVKGEGMKRYRQVDENLVEPKMLGSLLNDLERIYGKDLARHLEYQLINPAKPNLRNIVGHGGLKADDPLLEQKAYVVLQIYMAILSPIDVKMVKVSKLVPANKVA
jgi:hypothetical protein